MANTWDKGVVLALEGPALTTNYTYSQADPTQSSPLKYSGQSRHAGFYLRIQKAAVGSAFKTVTCTLEAAYRDLPTEYAKVLTVLHLGAGLTHTEPSINAPLAGSEATFLVTCPSLEDTIAKALRIGIKTDAVGVTGDLVEVRAVLW